MDTILVNRVTTLTLLVIHFKSKKIYYLRNRLQRPIDVFPVRYEHNLPIKNLMLYP
jgi:hypothetical protein